MPRLLIVKTSSLGDVIHNLPILADIRLHFPDMRFDWVVEEGFADVPGLHPLVEDVIPIAIRRWRHCLLSPATWREISAFRKRLATRRYDGVLDTQGLLKSAVIAACAHGQRHGYDWLSAREPLASLLYSHRHAVALQHHAVTRNRMLAAQALGYAMPATVPVYGLQTPDQTVPGLPSHYVVALHASSRPSKLWPTACWIALGGALARQGIRFVLPWGNAEERDRAEEIASTVPGALVLPRLRLAALAGVVAGALGAVGVDTGLIHLAAALDVPVVAVYTDSDPARTGVLGPHPARYLNLGGIGQEPSWEAVLAAFQHVAADRLASAL
jgi:heptosyltransferase-1